MLTRTSANQTVNEKPLCLYFVLEPAWMTHEAYAQAKIEKIFKKRGVEACALPDNQGQTINETSLVVKK